MARRYCAGRQQEHTRGMGYESAREYTNSKGYAMMPPLVTIGLLSILGAVFFFSAGFFFARFRAHCASESKPMEDGYGHVAHDAPAYCSLNGEGPGEHPEHFFRSETTLREELSQQQVELNKRNDIIHQLKKALEEQIAVCENLETDKLKLEEQTWGLMLKMEEIVKKGGEFDDRHRQALLEEREKSARAASQEKASLANQLREAKSTIESLKIKLDAVQDKAKENDVLETRAAFLAEQIKRMEMLKDRNTRLEAVEAENVSLREQLEQLKGRHSTIDLLCGLEVPDKTRRAATVTDSGRLGNAMQALVDRLVKNRGFEGAALADKHGAVLAGSGMHTEGLAASAALLNLFEQKIRNILPLKALHKMSIIDENSTTLAIQPVMISSSSLNLATFLIQTEHGRKPVLPDRKHNILRLGIKN